MIFVVRHGERADQTNDPQERKRIQKDYDPPLTAKGDKMAQVTGSYLLKVIQEYANSKKIQMKDLRINFMTSPFLRCIQTAINLMKELPNNSKLYIQDEIGEAMYTYDFDSDITPQLHLRTQQHPVMTHQYINGVSIIKERFIKNNALPQHVFPENGQKVFKRVSSFLNETVNVMNKDPNKFNTINICVTHQGIVEAAIEMKGKPSHYVDYCGVAQLILNEDNKDFKLGIAGQSFWK